jgi:hypothetical protein
VILASNFLVEARETPAPSTRSFIQKLRQRRERIMDFLFLKHKTRTIFMAMMLLCNRLKSFVLD